MDPGTPADVASKILAYSREVQISKVIEVIGGKDERAKRLLDSYLKKMDFNDCNLEMSMRRFLTTYRLAGVDSQVVNRLIEQFSFTFHAKDSTQLFLTKEEAHDFAYLLIVLQTSQHNPSIKSKIDMKSFLDQALINLPKSKEQLPPLYLESIYHSVTNTSFFTPLSRSLFEEGYNEYNRVEVGIRLSQAAMGEEEHEITESEFINSADLTSKQLFHYSNSLKVPETLIPHAQRYLLTMLSQKYLRYILVLVSSSHLAPTKVTTQRVYAQMHQLITLARAHAVPELVDKLFQVLYRFISSDTEQVSRIEGLLWENFESLRRSLVLLPKISLSKLMRGEVRESVKEAILAVGSVIRAKYDGKRHALQEREEGKVQGGNQAPTKAPSFFDLVFNYFTEGTTEAEDTREKNKKAEAKEIDSLEQIHRRLLGASDSPQNLLEETDQSPKKSQEEVSFEFQQSRVHELINLLSSQIRENMNQEEGAICLAFLDHLILKKIDHNSLESLEKLWVEMHLLVGLIIKPQKADEVAQPDIARKHSTGSANSGEGSASGKGADYEVITTDTSQDSLDSSNFMSDQVINDYFTKENCNVKTPIYESLNRHLILQMHLKLSKEIMKMKAQSQHIVREVQRIISQIIETGEPAKDQYATFDEQFLFNQLNEFFEAQQQQLKGYPKLSKLLRLSFILILKSQTKELQFNLQNEASHLSQLRQLQLFRSLCVILSDNHSLLPFDLIGLALDVFAKLRLPNLVQEKSKDIQDIIVNALGSIDLLILAIQRHSMVHVDQREEVWFKAIGLLQDRLLLNPSSHAYLGLTQQAFNIMKNAVLSHPFEVDSDKYPILRKLFSDVLFAQTFDRLQATNRGISDTPPGVVVQHEQSEDSDDPSDACYRLEQMSIIAVNNLSDIFIYYTATVFSHPNEQGEGHRFTLLAFLWLNLLKLLLEYAEKGNALDMHGLVVCAQDNIKRVLDFLIQQKIMREGGEDPEMHKLWNKSWDTIGAFFKDMKSQVLGVSAPVMATEVKQAVKASEPGVESSQGQEPNLAIGNISSV